jgi:hypothetical protein
MHGDPPTREGDSMSDPSQQAPAHAIGEAVARPPQGHAIEKLSVNVPRSLGERLRVLAFEERLSESSIAEVALRLLFAQHPDDTALGAFLRERGATLQRPRRRH